MKPVAYENARDSILEAARLACEPARVEAVALRDAQGRVLAEDAIASRPNPPRDDSAMDGYAVRAEELCGASHAAPVRLAVSRAVAAAGAREVATLPPREAMRIFTGAPIPHGADAVVRQEAARREGEHVVFWSEARAGENVRRAGEDIAAGATLVAAGCTIGIGETAALAALGIARPVVRARPRVALVTLGDELRDVGALLAPGEIYDCNAAALEAALLEAGSELHYRARTPDDPAAIGAALEGALAADVIVTAGGISVGDRDHAADGLAALGVEWRFRGVRMRPGHPAAFGVRARTGAPPQLVFGLPGNPAAALVAFEVLARPALRHVGGHRAITRPMEMARLRAPVTKRGGSTYFVRAIVERGPQGLWARPLDRQGAGMISSMVGYDAIAELDAARTSFEAGDDVPLHLVSANAGASSVVRSAPPLLAFVGRSGSGKTTLLEGVIASLVASGLRVAAIKHDAHGFSLDVPGKDTHRLRAAGAFSVAIVGPDAVGAVLAREDVAPAAPLDRLNARFFSQADLVVAEGFHDARCPKILVADERGLEPRDLDIANEAIAIVGAPHGELPRFERNDAHAVAAFIRAWCASRE
jgi:molybdopterin molybdotransferase